MDLAELDLSPNVAEALLLITGRERGLTLVCGPTGHGKSTTVEALLGLVKAQREVVALDRWNQTGRPIDIWCVVEAGALRDVPAAQVATELAERTHVLGIMRSGESLLAVRRLMDMGISPAVLGRVHPHIVTQRLCRRLCRFCRRPRVASQLELGEWGVSIDLFGIHRGRVYDAQGCERCKDGYRGQIAIFEVITAEVSTEGDVDKGEIWSTVHEDGVLKVLAGMTTLSELRRCYLPPR